jgi:glycosyltransferase involved in cell wall biosynthesis
MKKVALSAYACEPGRGSEEGVGWNMALEIARDNEAWVFTRTIHRKAIVSYPCVMSPPRLHFVYIDVPFWPHRWERSKRGENIHYYLWQLCVFFYVYRLRKQLTFDIVHHVTWVRYWMPSVLSLLPCPFVWGPVGGGEFGPASLIRGTGLRSRLFEQIRRVTHRIGELDPLVRITARRSAVALATTDETAVRMRSLGALDVRVCPAIGLSRNEREQLGSIPLPDEAPIRFVSIGVMHGWKGFHLGIHAFASAGLDTAEYWIIGDGPQKKRLKRLADRLGVSDQVRFLGWLTRKETLETLGKTHVLIHPSLHDSGGFVCIEALAAGRPVICLNLGGPGLLVPPDAGFLINASTADQVVKDIGQAMTTLATDRGLLEAMGSQGKAASANFDWSLKSTAVNEMYRSFSSGIPDSQPQITDPKVALCESRS